MSLFKTKNHTCLLTEDFQQLIGDVGFQSYTRYMGTDSYVPLVNRVKYLESVVETLLDHLDLEVEYKEKVTIVRDK